MRSKRIITVIAVISSMLSLALSALTVNTADNAPLSFVVIHVHTA